MKRLSGAPRIVWLVRLLVGIALAVVVTTTGLIGWNLQRLRAEREKVSAEHDRLTQAKRQVGTRLAASRQEIDAMLDGQTPWEPQDATATAAFVASIDAQLREPANATLAGPLTELRQQSAHLAALAGKAKAWRARYVPVAEDQRQQRTLEEVRRLLGQLRAAFEIAEGQRQLDTAIQYRRWREASGADAARQAQALLLDQARRNREDAANFDHQLHELARVAEVLAGEERLDSLPNLRANQLVPALDFLLHHLGPIAAAGSGEEILPSATLDGLVAAFLGKGARLDEVGPGIGPGRGGLYPLREAALTLRKERENLNSQLVTFSAAVDAGLAGFVNSANLRSLAMIQEMEQSLRVGLNHLLLFGSGSALLFCWLAWLITRGIGGQVGAIEQARVEAERTQEVLRRLMEEQQRAAGELAESHWELQLSEQRYRSLSDSAPIGIFDAAPDGEMRYLNPQWRQIAGLSAEQAAQEGWRRAVHPGDRATVFDQWETALRTHGMLDRELRFVQPGGEVRWVHIRSAVIRSETGAVLGHVGTVQDITQRKNAEQELAKMHSALLETSRQAGMAEVATSVLHNVGNVLNSVNVASGCVAEVLRKSKAQSVVRVAALLREHEADLATFTAQDPRGQQLPAFLTQLADHLVQEQTTALRELDQLQKNIEHIKEIVAMQQSYASASGVTETVQLTDLIEDTLRMSAESFAHHDLRVVREFAEVPPVTVEKHKVLQILVNLVRNAKHACQAANRPERQVTLRVFNGDGRVKVAISDNGVGIPPENLTRIFHHGFTTKKNGHGFGLHSGALAAQEMGGTLRVESRGPGQGATFTLELPATAPY